MANPLPYRSSEEEAIRHGSIRETPARAIDAAR